MRRGALLDAQADAEVALEIAPAETFAQLHNIPIVALARVHAERGFPQRSLEIVDAQLTRDGSGGGDAAILTLERARILRALRRPREAADVALAVGAKVQALHSEGAFMLPWSAVAAEALLERGDTEPAARLAAHAVTLAEQSGAAGPIGCALRVLGLVEHDLKRLRTAERAQGRSCASSMRAAWSTWARRCAAADNERRHVSPWPQAWSLRTAALPTRSSRAPTRSCAPPALDRGRSCAAASRH